MTHGAGRVTFIRHAQSEANRRGRHVPDTDGLSVIGVQQANLLAERLSMDAPTLLLHSGSARTSETIAPLLELAPNIPVRLDLRLREGEIGDWVGQPLGLRARIADEAGIPLWEVRPPGGESYLDIDLRIQDLLRHLTTMDEEASVVAVTHGRLTSLLLRQIEGVAWASYVPDRRVHTSIASVSFRSTPVVISRHDYSHLPDSLVTR